MAARTGLAVLAVAVCAWFALGVRAFREVASVNVLLSGPARITPEQARDARAKLDQAAWLNPDQEVNFLRAQVAARDGHKQRALTIARGLAHREPQNVNAWLLVSILVRPGSLPYRQAEAQLRRLVPPAPP